MSIVAGAALVDKNDKVIIVLGKKWDKKKSKWGFPKGHREATDKCDFDCMVREVKEEIGLDITKTEYKIMQVCQDNALMLSYVMYIIEIDIDLCEVDLKIDENEISNIEIISWDELRQEYELMPDMYNRSIGIVFQ